MNLPRYIMIQLSKIKGTGGVLKAAKESYHIQGNNNKDISKFLSRNFINHESLE
jgi:translation initiation factor 1 (eIF-1/SUI1)